MFQCLSVFHPLNRVVAIHVNFKHLQTKSSFYANLNLEVFGLELAAETMSFVRFKYKRKKWGQKWMGKVLWRGDGQGSDA